MLLLQGFRPGLRAHSAFCITRAMSLLVVREYVETLGRGNSRRKYRELGPASEALEPSRNSIKRHTIEDTVSSNTQILLSVVS